MNDKLKLSDYIAEFNKIKKNDCLDNKKHIKISVVRSFTDEMIEPVLVSELYKKGFYCEMLFGGFNQFFQDVINSESSVYKFNPDFVIVDVRPEDYYNILFENYYSQIDNIDTHINKIISDFNTIIESINKNCSTCIIINNFTVPYFSPFGIFHFQSSNGIVNIIRKLNVSLADIAAKFENVIIADSDEVISNAGRKNIYDLKMWEVSKNPYTLNYYREIADCYCKIINAYYGNRIKCIVLDLDNTLWKGVVGEDGFNKIKINIEFQKQLLYLNQTGIILAVNSKNNLDDALNVINNHPDMILRADNFADMQINWNDKASNIRAIASNLNIGIESIAFIDDNLAECELITKTFPEINVINLPKTFFDCKDIIKQIDFDFISLTNEDIEKSQKYKQRALVNKMKSEYSDITQFLSELEMKAVIYKASDFLIPRIAQLTQKTNQFNMSTKRYTENDIRNMVNAGAEIFSLKLVDKFGDNGITGVIIALPDNEGWFIDTFLLSCRIMNRNAEFSFMGFVLDYACKKGIKYIKAQYVPTKKNVPVKDLYNKMGFEFNDGYWYFNTENNFDMPDYIKVEFMEENDL